MYDTGCTVLSQELSQELSHPLPRLYDPIQQPVELLGRIVKQDWLGQEAPTNLPTNTVAVVQSFPPGISYTSIRYTHSFNCFLISFAFNLKCVLISSLTCNQHSLPTTHKGTAAS